MLTWQPYENGVTLGDRGNEGGQIIRDEMHPVGGRITLEQDCLRAPHAITAVVYGWLMHTRFIADEPTAVLEYTKMQASMTDIIQLIGEDGIPADLDAMDAAINRFIESYP